MTAKPTKTKKTVGEILDMIRNGEIDLNARVEITLEDIKKKDHQARERDNKNH